MTDENIVFLLLGIVGGLLIAMAVMMIVSLNDTSKRLKRFKKGEDKQHGATD